MIKLDLDKFWMLSRCQYMLTDGQGRFCALGAFNEAAGLDQEYDHFDHLDRKSTV